MRLTLRGGIWQARVFGVRRSTGCSDKEAARKIAVGWERDAADPDLAAKERTTVEDVLALLLKDRREQVAAGKLSAETVAYYEDKCAALGAGLGLSTLASHLTAAVLDDYVSTRRAAKESTKGRRIATSEHTIHKEIQALRAALKLAKRRKLWRGDLDEILPEVSSDYQPRERWISGPAELNAILAQLDSDAAARVAFSVATGAELAAVEAAQDDDWTATAVRVRGTKNDRRDRIVPLLQPWQQSLLEYALRHARGTDGRLFSGTEAEWRSAMKYACRRAKVAHLAPVDCRRTFCTWLLADGGQPATVAPLMGHANSRMIEAVYGQLRARAVLLERLQRELGLSSVNCAAGVSSGSEKTAIDGTSETPPTAVFPLYEVAPRAGFEPATRGLTVRSAEWVLPRDPAALRGRASSNERRVCRGA